MRIVRVWKRGKVEGKREIIGKVKRAYRENVEKLSTEEILFGCMYVLFKYKIGFDSIEDIISNFVNEKGLRSKKTANQYESMILFLLLHDYYKEKLSQEGFKKLNDVLTNCGDDFFDDFIDWYEIEKTYNTELRNKICELYPVKDYPRILCVGDGINCHLSRKLAKEGYKVVCVDPKSNNKFSCPKVKEKDNTVGSILVINDFFSSNSKKLIDETDLIVCSKGPMIVPDILKSGKRAMFTVSENAEIYDIVLDGIRITSGAQLERLIENNYNVQTIKMNIDDSNADGNNQYRHLIFISDNERYPQLEMKTEDDGWGEL